MQKTPSVFNLKPKGSGHQNADYAIWCAHHQSPRTNSKPLICIENYKVKILEKSLGLCNACFGYFPHPWHRDNGLSIRTACLNSFACIGPLLQPLAIKYAATSQGMMLYGPRQMSINIAFSIFSNCLSFSPYLSLSSFISPFLHIYTYIYICKHHPFFFYSIISISVLL